MSALDRVLAAAAQPVTTTVVDPDRFAFAAGEDPESSGDSLEDEDQPDWDESDWDDVRSHLEQDSPWFGKVMRGESPGEPDADTALSCILALTPRTAEASTVHEPTVPPGGPGLFHIKGRQLPPYVQHLYKHLVAKYGKHRAYGVAIGIVKKWAAGVNPGGKGKGHKVHGDVQAAAAKNMADWETSKGMAHAHHGAKEAGHAAASNVELAVVRGYERDIQGRLERVNEYFKDNRLKVGVIGPEAPVAKSELLNLYRATPALEAEFRGHLRDAREHYAAGRHEEAVSALGRAQDVARQRSMSFTADALEKQKKAIGAEQRAAAVTRAAAAAKQHVAPKRGLLGRLGRNPVAASQLELAAPASWPSGKPYSSSFLPPGPTTSLLQGQPARTGVITNGPGSAPARRSQLRQAPSQTVSAAPPLPPGVTLPAPKDIDVLAAQVPDGADITLSNSVRTHLRTAAGKLRADDRIGALSALRSAQAGVHASYRAAYAENMPNTAQVYSFAAVPPAEQSSATSAMLAGRQTTEKYRALNHQIATMIDQFRRDYFGGQFNQAPYARFTGTGEEMLALAQIKGYERENKFGRVVTVHNYIREGKPYSGKLVGDEADEAIRAGVAKGEYGEPTGYFQTSDGKKMWGWYGAAGLLVRHTDAKGTKRYLLQKRAPWVQDGNTYSVPGGAMDHINGKPETPEQAAHRESREELGRELPAGTKMAEVRSKTFGEGKGAWSYHTVVMDTPHMFDPEGEGLDDVHDTRNEAKGYVWAAPHEMTDLPLHPHFRATAEELGMPPGGGTVPAKFSAGEIAAGVAKLVAGASHG